MKMRPKHNSATSGRSKGIWPSPIQKGICRRNRSWKDPNYEVIMQTLGNRALKKA